MNMLQVGEIKGKAHKYDMGLFGPCGVRKQSFLPFFSRLNRLLSLPFLTLSCYDRRHVRERYALTFFGSPLGFDFERIAY